MHAMNSMDTPPCQRFLPTGSFGLDLALEGGVPLGQVSEFYGPSESGKSSLALSLAAQAQVLGKAVVWIDADQTFDLAYARHCGLNPERLILAQPVWLEAGLEIAERLAASGAIGLAVLDGADALPGQAELLSPAPPDQDWQAIPQLSIWLRRIGPWLTRWQTSLVITHGGLYPPGRSSGAQPVSRAYHHLAGNLGRLALPLQAALRLRLEPLALLHQAGRVVGRRIRATILKSSLKPCLPAAEFDIMYSQGVLRSGEVLDLGMRLGVIHLKGTHYAFEQVDLGMGREQAIHFLHHNAALRLTIEQALNQAMCKSMPQAAS